MQSVFTKWNHVGAVKRNKSAFESISNFEIQQNDNKVQCSLSAHEMPCKVDIIKSYVNGKKFKKLQERDDQLFEKYKPHLEPTIKKHHEHQLFCKLTFRHVNKTVTHVERHVNGVKYKRALARWEECQRNGTEFKPPRGRKKVQDRDLGKGKNSVKQDNDEGDMSETDSLSDLHPAGKPCGDDNDEEEDENEDDDNEEDDYEEDEDEEEDENNTKANTDSSTDDSDFEFEDLGNTEEKKFKKQNQITHRLMERTLILNYKEK